MALQAIFSFVTLLAICLNNGSHSAGFEESTTTAARPSEEQEGIVFFDPLYNYNSSLTNMSTNYYKYLKEYYETTVTAALLNTTAQNFTVSNVTIVGFKPPNISASAAGPSMGVQVEAGLMIRKLLNNYALPGESTIHSTISYYLHLAGLQVTELITAPIDWLVCKPEIPYNLSQIEPTFIVQTRSGTISFNISTEDQIQDMVDQLNSASFILWSVVFIVHGFRNTVNEPWMSEIAQKLLVIDDFTVFITGWGNGANLPPYEYPQSAANTKTVSAAVANVVKSIRGTTPIATYFYCIGHSLGAHVCGQAGNMVHFDRISGLDPAGPAFIGCPWNIPLSLSSAQCVDVIHTNGAIFGTMQPMGNVDFYANCGENQPCDNAQTCSHSLATNYFIESIIPYYPSPSYPAAQGPCNGDFFHDCKPCDSNGCWTLQQSCNPQSVVVTQPYGYWSVCSRTSGCPQCVNKNSDWDNYYGIWYVAIKKQKPYFLDHLNCPNMEYDGTMSYG